MKYISLGLTATLFFLSCFSSYSRAEKEYSIKGDAPIGTTFKQKIITSSIPLDLNYNEMNEEQRAFVRSSYDDLKADEHPPYPTHGIGDLMLNIKKAIDSYRVRSGEIFAVALIGSDGKVKDAAVYSSPNKKIAEFIVKLLYTTEFDPATCGGKNCAMEYPLEFTIGPGR